MKNNPYQTLNTSKYVESSSVSLELKKEDGTPIKVEGLSEYLTIAVPRQVPDPEPEPENVNNSVSVETALKKLRSHARFQLATTVVKRLRKRIIPLVAFKKL